MADTEEKEMNAEYDQAIDKQQIQEIKDSQEAIHDVIWWKKRLDWTGWAMYFIGFAIWVLPDPDNDRGLLVLVIGFILLMVNGFINTGRLRRRRMITQNLLDAFTRKKALPLYHDMLEKFADQPHLHIHLSNNGTIVITDRRNKGNK